MLLVAHSFTGGAGRAAERLFRSFSHYEKDLIDFRALAGQRNRTEDCEINPSISWFHPTSLQRVRVDVPTAFLRAISGAKNKGLHSPALIKTGLANRINFLNPDVVNLHWLGRNTLSIKEVAEIRAPIVWTLHDEWFYRGAEHYANDSRPFEGYEKESESGGKIFDLNRMVWNVKQRHWTTPMHLISPSNWLARNASTSIIGRKHTVHVVPNALDTDFWKPLSKKEAAATLGLNPETTYLLSGSLAADSDPRKGRELVTEAFRGVVPRRSKEGSAEVLFFGGKPGQGRIGEIDFRDLGTLNDIQLRAAYSLASGVFLGSRQENFPQTATEASACGTPVIAFNVGGLPDIVSHGETGFLIEPFQTEKMTRAVENILEDPTLKSRMGEVARKKAQALWSEEVVSAQYREVFLQAAKQ